MVGTSLALETGNAPPIDTRVYALLEEEQTGFVVATAPERASLVEAGLSTDDAFDTYSAVSVHVRGSVVLQRLRENKVVCLVGDRDLNVVLSPLPRDKRAKHPRGADKPNSPAPGPFVKEAAIRSPQG